MRKMVIFLFVYFMGQFAMAQHNADSTQSLLETYLENNPQTVRAKFIYDGCNILVSADEDNLLVQVMVINPMIQMRLLMQECYLFIDPTGKKKEKYAVILPSAKYVKSYMGNTAPRPTSGDERPNLTELITLMKLYGAEWDVNGRITRLHPQRFRLVFDTDEDALIYSVLIPKNWLSKEKDIAEQWAFGFYSPIDGNAPQAGAPMPNPNGRPDNPNNGGGMQGDDAKLKGFLSKVIRQWTLLPIKEIEGLNSNKMTCRVLGGKAISDNQALEVSVSIIEDTLAITVEPKIDVLQLDFIMQGLELTLFNASGDSIAIRFPSAFDVKDKVHHHPDETTPPQKLDESPSRPDLRYVLAVLNDTILGISGSVEANALMYEISADPNSGQVVFQAKLIVKDFMPDAIVQVLLLSKPSLGMTQSLEFEHQNKNNTLPERVLFENETQKSHSFQETLTIPLSYD